MRGIPARFVLLLYICVCNTKTHDQNATIFISLGGFLAPMEVLQQGQMPFPQIVDGFPPASVGPLSPPFFCRSFFSPPNPIITKHKHPLDEIFTI